MTNKKKLKLSKRLLKRYLNRYGKRRVLSLADWIVWDAVVTAPYTTQQPEYRIRIGDSDEYVRWKAGDDWGRIRDQVRTALDSWHRGKGV